MNRREPRRLPAVVVVALVFLGLLTAGLAFLMCQFWLDYSWYVETGADPVYPLIAALLYTLGTAATALAGVGILRQSAWALVLGWVIAALGAIGAIVGAALTRDASGLLGLVVYGTLLGLLMAPGTTTWCSSARERART